MPRSAQPEAGDGAGFSECYPLYAESFSTRQRGCHLAPFKLSHSMGALASDLKG